MILIAESGSTKTDWSLLGSDSVLARFHTTGLNPFFTQEPDVTEALAAQFPQNMNPISVQRVQFFGAGCSSPDRNQIIHNGIRAFLPHAEIQIRTDLEAAALALFPKDEGIVAILGTGSNSAWIKNGVIMENRRSWGYILGDEGSANHIGRLFVRSFLNDDLPVNLVQKIEQKYDISKEKILDGVYRSKFPNRYLAGMAEIVASNLQLGMIRDMVKGSFRDFFVWHLSHYTRFPELPIRFVGSTAAGFNLILHEVGSEFGARIERIERSPLIGLERWMMEHFVH
jgi:glucosamine kinase